MGYSNLAHSRIDQFRNGTQRRSQGAAHGTQAAPKNLCPQILSRILLKCGNAAHS